MDYRAIINMKISISFLREQQEKDSPSFLWSVWARLARRRADSTAHDLGAAQQFHGVWD